MMNGMATLPAALGGQLGLSLQGHSNINHQLSQLRNGGRSRMPDAHVEMLLDCYKLVQEERTLDSGRLGKGAFHQITEQLNKRTVGNYCKDQVTAKLQNLKAQFRQRRAAVEAGHGEMRDWKWYDRMAEIMADGKDESGYGDFSSNDRQSKTPPSINPVLAQFSPFGLNNGLGKILQNLPPQIRDNPAAIAQIMNGSPLFGLPGMPSPLIGQPIIPKNSSTPCESDDDDKTKLHDHLREQSKHSPINGLLHQQQNVALQRSLMARVQAQNQLHSSVTSSRIKSPKSHGRHSPENPLKRHSDDNLCSTPDMKRSRQSPLTPSVPIPYHNSQLEGALANLAVFMPRSQDNGQMLTARRDCLASLRNLAFQLFTGLSAVLAQMEQPLSEQNLHHTEPPKPLERTVPTEAAVTMPPMPSPANRIASLETSQLHIPQINIPSDRASPKATSTHVDDDVEEIEQMDDSENSKVSDLADEAEH